MKITISNDEPENGKVLSLTRSVGGIDPESITLVPGDELELELDSNQKVVMREGEVAKREPSPPPSPTPPGGEAGDDDKEAA